MSYETKVHLKNDKIQQCKRSISREVLLGILTNFSSIAPSMSLGFSAVALPVLKDTAKLNAQQLSWFASIAALATPFGSFLSGPLADRVGRRTAICFANTVCFAGWITIAIACYLKTTYYPMLIVGRLLTGLSVGMCSSPATIYMTEVSGPALRGIVTTWASISFSLGILLVYCLGYFLKDALDIISLTTATLPIVGLTLVAFCVPESPAWLIGKNRKDEAKISMCRILGIQNYSEEAQAELETLMRNRGAKTEKQSKSMIQQFWRKVRYLMQPRSLKPFCIILSYFFFQQFSGTVVLVFYALDIVKNAGVTLDPYLTVVIIGLLRLFSCVLASLLAKTFGRRPLSIFSGASMAICCLSLVGFIHYEENNALTLQCLTILPLILLLVYVTTSSVGFLPIPFALAAELFPTKVRGTASGLLSGLGYLFNFIAVKIYPDMLNIMGRKGIFCFYGVTALVGTIFVTCLLPETRGKSLQEIEEYFGNKVVNIEEKGSLKTTK